MAQNSLDARTELLGVRVDDVSIGDLLDHVDGSLSHGARLMVVNANAHLIMLAQSRPWLTALYKRADVAFCDGAGVQFALRLLTGRMPHRHTPPQWIEQLARRVAGKNGSVFWLGGDATTVSIAAARLTERTGIRTAGVHHGYFDVTQGSAENEDVIAAINAAKPAVLLINMGMPRQEEWLWHNWDRLDARVAITAGALVDHMAGRVKRPPAWVANAGLEWAVRLAIEPRRLWRRYVIGLPRFMALVLREHARRQARA